MLLRRPIFGPAVCALAMGLCCLAAGAAVAAERDDEDAPSPPAVPNVYLDLRTTFARVPSGTLALGFGNNSLATALEALAVRRGAALNGWPAAKSIAVDLPLTVDVNDRLSLYGGVSGSTTDIGAGWSTFDVTSWNIGAQAELHQQNGGHIPTIMLQSTLTQSVPNDRGMTNSLNNILEFGYALDEDETRGWLAGVQSTVTDVAGGLARVRPNTILYAGGYYQWPSNWKATGRFGIQSFGGAEIAGRMIAGSFTQPIVRLDFDRMDDNDNRLFGITAQIAWMPKPSYQLTLRTPLYAVRN